MTYEEQVAVARFFGIYPAVSRFFGKPFPCLIYQENSKFYAFTARIGIWVPVVNPGPTVGVFDSAVFVRLGFYRMRGTTGYHRP